MQLIMFEFSCDLSSQMFPRSKLKPNYTLCPNPVGNEISIPTARLPGKSSTRQYWIQDLTSFKLTGVHIPGDIAPLDTGRGSFLEGGCVGGGVSKQILISIEEHHNLTSDPLRNSSY
jgi:hypothetical protein